MAIRDIFVPLAGYPLRPSPEAIRHCATIARAIGAQVSVAVVDVEVSAAAHPFDGPEYVIDRGAVARARSDFEGALNVFLAAARESGVRYDCTAMTCTRDHMPAMLANEARLHDLSLLPVRSHDASKERTLLELIFSSGRPVLIFPEEHTVTLPDRAGRVAIAWNHSAQAARAVGDAMPLLRQAASVRIFTVADRVTAAQSASGTALVRHLAEHGVVAEFETVVLDGSSVGKVFESYAKARGIDLLVMGGYGHSWLREFTWGGATNTILESPPCWVLMSH